MNFVSRFFATIALCLVSGAAFAQTLPLQLLDQQRPLQGNAMRACVDDFSAGSKLDRAVAQAIGDALFLKVNFVEAIRGFPLDGDGYLAELQVHLNNDCDLFMGISVQPNSPFPEWAMVTRTYATIPFVLAVSNPDYKRLADIPYGRFIGTALGSLGERVYSTSNSQRPADQRWKRLPYANFDLMLTRMLEGKLDGMVLWQPSLAKLQAENPAAKSLKVIAFDPLPTASVNVGALISNRNTYLRTQVDKAIEELSADGTFAQIMDDLGFAKAD
jgi:hypothetical protein